jgi:hypothetical protein
MLDCESVLDRLQGKGLSCQPGDGKADDSMTTASRTSGSGNTHIAGVACMHKLVADFNGPTISPEQGFHNSQFHGCQID